MIIIKAKRDGFRRCGVAHSAKATEYQDDAFTSEQLAVLQAEPMLHVKVIDELDDDGAEPDDDKPAEPAKAEKSVKPAPKTSRKKNSKKADKE
jgi:hypothetical protein